MTNTTTTGKAPKVLIVEDQAPMRATLRDFLTLSFSAWQVLEAADGVTAMRVFTEHRPPLVLMDVCLPDTNGIELARRIKAEAPETVVVVMSIQTGPHVAEQALAAGAAAFIGKDRLSTELAPLIAKLNSIYESRR
jgi:DNA-binding NarL/FixJ family response regulator